MTAEKTKKGPKKGKRPREQSTKNNPSPTLPPEKKRTLKTSVRKLKGSQKTLSEWLTDEEATSSLQSDTPSQQLIDIEEDALNGTVSLPQICPLTFRAQFPRYYHSPKQQQAPHPPQLAHRIIKLTLMTKQNPPLARFWTTRQMQHPCFVTSAHTVTNTMKYSVCCTECKAA